MKRGFSEKKRIFVEEYALTGDLKKACEKSGYTEKYGKRLTNSDEVKKIIEEKTAEKILEEVANDEEILRFLTKIMRDKNDSSIRERMRAVELLTKRKQLFCDDEDEEVGVLIVDDIK